jgi:hypothetical protein
MNFEEDFADFEEIVGDHGRSGERVAHCVVPSEERIEERSLARAWELFQGNVFTFYFRTMIGTKLASPCQDTELFWL